jgi:hypothetical protein
MQRLTEMWLHAVFSCYCSSIDVQELPVTQTSVSHSIQLWSMFRTISGARLTWRWVAYEFVIEHGAAPPSQIAMGELNCLDDKIFLTISGGGPGIKSPGIGRHVDDVPFCSFLFFYLLDAMWKISLLCAQWRSSISLRLPRTCRILIVSLRGKHQKYQDLPFSVQQNLFNIICVTPDVCTLQHKIHVFCRISADLYMAVNKKTKSE